MNKIKVEVEDDLRHDNYCFICLQHVQISPKEKFNTLYFLFSYLKIGDKANFIVCNKCEAHLIKFEKLSNILEKVRLEMDYLLDFISKISKSNDVKPAPIEFAFVRESVMKKCKEKIYNPKPNILLERVNLSKLVKRETSTPDFEDNWSPNSDNNYDDESTSSDSDTSEGSAAPLGDIKNIKSEINSETLAPICNEESFASKATKKRVKCTKCAKTFNCKAALKAHNNHVHLRLKPFKCSTCEKRFSRIENLRRHVEALHLRFYPNKCKCDICGKSFTTARNLRTHEAIHNKPKPHIPIDKMVSCKKCGKAFDNTKTLKYHMYNVHPVKKHPCHICKRMFNARTNLYKHIAALHDKPRYCCQAGCDKGYSQQRYLVHHYRKNHPDFTFTIVKKTDFYSLSDKFKVISETGNKRMECVICRKHFKTVETVKFHLQTIHRLMKFKCKFCGYETGSKASFDDHIKQEHDTLRLVDKKESSALLGKCMDIKSEINLENSANKIKSKSKSKPTKCTKCSKTFYNKNSMELHVNRVHLRLKPFKCECGKSFVSNYELRSHKTTHSKPKPQIPIDKLVSCKICGKAFDNPTSIRFHVYNVHSEKKFPCHICKKMFKVRGQLNRHISGVHEKHLLPSAGV